MESPPGNSLNDQLHALLTKTITLARRVVEAETAWDTPWQLSVAGTEMAAEESQPGRLTGSWPWSSSLVVARWALEVAIEQAVGFEKVMASSAPSSAADGVCRAVLESASLVWWLLDLEIDAEQRLARALVYRLHTAQHTARAIKALDLASGESPADYGELPDSVEREIASLGPGWSCELPGTRVIHNGARESWPSYTDRVAALIRHVWTQSKMPYAILSAVTHTELLGISRALAGHSGPAGVRTVLDPTGLWCWQDTYLVIGSLVLTADRAAYFLGLAECLDALRDWIAELDQALPALRPRMPED